MKVLVIGPRHTIRDLRSYYASPMADDVYYAAEEDLIASDIRASAEALLLQGYDGYIGIVDWSSLFAAYMNHRTGAPAPSPNLVATLQDKLDSRQLQASYADYIGNAINPADVSPTDFPLFMKPRRATMSFLAQVVPDIETVQHIIRSKQKYLSRRNEALWGQLYDLLNLPRQPLSEFVLETPLPEDAQVTLDGCVQNGVTDFFCFTRSHFYPNQISFRRFDLPYQMNKMTESLIMQHAKKFIAGTGFDNSLFDIEYKVDLETGGFGMIEINTRPSSQFMYPIQCISGVHPLDRAIDVVLGRDKPSEKRIIACQQASICVLRRDTDATVVKIPSNKEMMWLSELHELNRWNVYAQPNERLSDYPSDSRSYRYAELTILDNIKHHIFDHDDKFKAMFNALVEFRE